MASSSAGDGGPSTTTGGHGHLERPTHPVHVVAEAKAEVVALDELSKSFSLDFVLRGSGARVCFNGGWMQRSRTS